MRNLRVGWSQVAIFRSTFWSCRLSLIDDAIANGDQIGVSAISIAEMVYLIEKGRIPAKAWSDFLAAVADPQAA